MLSAKTNHRVWAGSRYSRVGFLRFAFFPTPVTFPCKVAIFIIQPHSYFIKVKKIRLLFTRQVGEAQPLFEKNHCNSWWSYTEKDHHRIEESALGIQKSLGAKVANWNISPRGLAWASWKRMGVSERTDVNCVLKWKLIRIRVWLLEAIFQKNTPKLLFSFSLGKNAPSFKNSNRPTKKRNHPKLYLSSEK